MFVDWPTMILPRCRWKSQARRAKNVARLGFPAPRRELAVPGQRHLPGINLPLARHGRDSCSSPCAKRERFDFFGDSDVFVSLAVGSCSQSGTSETRP